MTSIDWINILSYILAVENLKSNEEQINALESHLSKQDKQYDQIIKLLKEKQDGK